MEKRKFLFEEINKIEISLSEEQINQFLSYCDLLVEWRFLPVPLQKRRPGK